MAMLNFALLLDFAFTLILKLVLLVIKWNNTMNKSIVRAGMLSVFMYSSNALAEGTSLGSMSGTLLVGGGILTKLMWAACIVVGIALIAAAFTQFQIHRRNPKLVPLTTPVLYLILGIVAIAIPFVPQINGFLGNKGQEGVRGSAAPPPAAHGQNYDSNDIDAPLY